MSVFYELLDFPIHTVINIPTREEAIGFKRGDIRLAFCDDCGFIGNIAFDKEELQYGSNFEESQGFSPTFKAFSENLAQDLVNRYGLHGKTILEIGCGKGEFLSMLCSYGQNQGIGFDPAYVEGRAEATSGREIRFVKDYYSEKYADTRADFICCQMTLEHISDTGAFVGMIRRTAKEDTSRVVFFQVPDVTRILRGCSFEDIYYEHCSYFSPGSISNLFERCGFEVLDVRTEYGDQYLMIEARVGGADHGTPEPNRTHITELKELVNTFKARTERKIEGWREGMTSVITGRERAVVWGSGSKGVAYLINIGGDVPIEYVVDINPYRQGMFMPGTGQEIIAPGRLESIRPDVVVVMNRVYENEVKEMLAGIGLSPRIIAL